MKTLHFGWLAASLIVISSAWAEEGIPVIEEAKHVQTQEAALYQEVNDYLNQYRTNKLGSVGEQQKLIVLTQQRVSLKNQIESLKNSLKNVQKSKRALYRVDRKQDDFSKDYASLTKEAQDKLDAKEAELAKLEKAIDAQEAMVSTAQKGEASDRQFEKKMFQFRERNQLINEYQMNKAGLKGEKTPEQHGALKELLSKSNADLKREYSQPRPELKPIDIQIAPMAKVEIAKPGPIQLNAQVIQPKLEQNRCKDEALMAIAQGAVTKNPRILNDLFEVTSLKMAYALNESGSAKKTIESSIQALMKKTDVQAARIKVSELYSGMGRNGDLKQIDRLTSGKSSYYGVQSRLDNAHASALILMLAKESDRVTDFTEADAATVWAVEKVRASQDQGKFAIGKYDGNLLNFSTKVYQLSQRGMTHEQLTQRLNDKSGVVDASFNSALSALDQESKKCLSAGECKPIETLSGEQMNAVRSLVMKLAQRSPAVEKTGAQIDLRRTTVQNGVITLSIQK